MANTMEAFVHVRAVDTIGHFPYFAWSGKEATMRDQIKLLYKYGFLPFTAITQGGYIVPFCSIWGHKTQ